jgi:hypothetical protein
MKQDHKHIFMLIIGGCQQSEGEGIRCISINPYRYHNIYLHRITKKTFCK